MANDRKRKYDLLMHKREEFVKDNSSYIQSKKEKRDKERLDYKEYKLNFFPFTHGEQLEDKRSQMKDTMKEELMRHMKYSASKMKAAW